MNFSVCLLLSISTIIWLRLEKTLCVISTFEDQLSLNLWHNMIYYGAILCALEKNVFSAVVQYNIMYIYIRVNWFIVSSSLLFLYYFCLVVLSITESRFSSLQVLLSNSFDSAIFCRVWVYYFCLVVLSITESRYSSLQVLLSNSFDSAIFCFVYFLDVLFGS